MKFCLNISNKMKTKWGWKLIHINVRLLYIQLFDRIYILFWGVSVKSNMINSHKLRTNQVIEVIILTNQDINRDKSVM